MHRQQITSLIYIWSSIFSLLLVLVEKQESTSIAALQSVFIQPSVQLSSPQVSASGYYTHHQVRLSKIDCITFWSQSIIFMHAYYGYLYSQRKQGYSEIAEYPNITISMRSRVVTLDDYKSHRCLVQHHFTITRSCREIGTIQHRSAVICLHPVIRHFSLLVILWRL